MSKLSKAKLIQILRSAGELPGLRGWHKETVEQIVALIKKPQVTEDEKEEMLIRIYIEEKAKELITMVSNLYPREGSPCIIPKSKAKDFIRSLVEEIEKRK